MADFALNELLSPLDFEHLIRDLLSEELGIEFMAFAEGSDGGIDLRYSKSNSDNTIIVQCKRKNSVGKGELEEESKKLESLKLEHYYLATSCDLSIKKVNLILAFFSKWMKDESYLYPKNRINKLLDKHQAVLKRHYKLWVNSSGLFDTFINKSLIERSKFLFSSIKEESKYYVRNESYNEAIEILNKRDYIIISGNPGIGKTTLARILLREFAQKGFEVIDLKSIKDGERFLEEKSSEKQAFYFDDFLGENFLEYDVLGGRSSDLLNFIKRISHAKNKKLILTTREYILKQAKDRYEKLNDDDLELAKHILDLEKYSERDKAYILYNHLYYSNIKHEYIQNIIETESYKKIINHRNYNPRIIERMTVRLKDVNPAEYSSEFLNHLDNPFIIWDRAFDNQISEGSQGLLYTLLSFDGQVLKDELKDAFNSFLNIADSGLNGNIHHFTKYLKEIEDSFINSNASSSRRKIIFRFQNPSVKDFLINILKQNIETQIQLINSIKYFNQLRFFIGLYKTISPSPRVNTSIERKLLQMDEIKNNAFIYPHINFVTSPRDTRVERLQICAERLNSSSNSELKSFLLFRIDELEIGELESDDRGKYLDLLDEFKDEIKTSPIEAVSEISTSIHNPSDISNLIKLFDVFPHETKKYLAKNKELMSLSIEEAINEALEEATHQFEVEEIQDCLDEIDSFNTHSEYSIIENVGSLYISSQERRDIITAKNKSEENADLDEDDALKTSPEEQFNAESLFRIENFSK